MEVYETEEQQVEALRQWFRKRGKRLVVISSFIILCVLATLYIRHHRQLTQEAASSLYQGMILAIEKQDPVTAKTKAMHLSKDYEASVYGSVAKLYLAKVALEQQDFTQAHSYLEWVIKHSKNSEFKELARLRLAKVLFSQRKTQAALELLNVKNKKNDHYVSLLQELKADILRAENKPEEALALYKLAQESILKKEIHNPLLKMKLEELGEV